MKIEKIDPLSKFELIKDLWDPHILAELNGQQVKIARVKGRFDWHHHDHEDELFYVIDGKLKIEFEDGEVILESGEMVVVPKGVRHCPVADEETKILLFEPASTLNTGNVKTEKTKESLKKI